MSTHNICFYEELTKIIFQLSSNITLLSPESRECSALCCHLAAEKQHKGYNGGRFFVANFFAFL